MCGRRCCSCCCKFCMLPFIVILVVTIGMLAVPQVFHAIEQADGRNRNLLTMILVGIGFEKMGQCGSDIVQDTMSYSSVSPKKRTCSSLSFGRQHGWDGDGVEDTMMFGLRRQSSASVRKVVYDPKLCRSIDIVIAINTTNIPAEVREMALPGIWPIVIQQNTDDPERMRRRTFWAENLPALSDVPDDKVAAFKVPAGVSKTDFRNFHVIFAALSVNYFGQLFGHEVDWDGNEIEEYRDAQMNFFAGAATKGIQYKNKIAGQVMSMFIGNPAEILAEKRKRLEKKVFSTKAAKRFIAQAQQQGFKDGEAELRHFIFGLTFAGLLGSPQMTEAIILMIDKDPKTYVPLFRANPDAFMLEAARFQVTVGGMLFIENKDQKFTISGKVVEVHEGDYGMTWNSGHNMDPNVFGGPNKDEAFAQKFIPGRENADRLLTWNNELRDARKCKNAAGCPEAPRPCPGIHLARRVSRQVVEFFIGGFEEEMRQKQEL